MADTIKTRETFTVYTGKDIPIAVGDCTYPERYKDISNQEKLRSRFSLTLCREKKTYEADVEKSGKWYDWNSTTTPIPGTEKLSYELAQDEKTSEQIFDAQNPMQQFNVQNDCNSVRQGYVMAQSAQNGQNPCK